MAIKECRKGTSQLRTEGSGNAPVSLVSCALPSPSLRPLSSLGRLRNWYAPLD